MSEKQERNKIILRALEPYDLEILYRWENDQEIWKVSNTLAPFSNYILQKYIEDSHRDIYETKQLRLMIDTVDPDKNQISVGMIDLFDFDPFHNRAGIGILIGEKAKRNTGLASLALTEIKKYAFEILHLHQIYANITPDNTASLKVFKKAGFVSCGIKKDWIKIKGGYIDEFIYQLINLNY
jgi:diamine N-acetyltransferase